MNYVFLDVRLGTKDLIIFDLKSGFYIKYSTYGWSPNTWNGTSIFEMFGFLFEGLNLYVFLNFGV